MSPAQDRVPCRRRAGRTVRAVDERRLGVFSGLGAYSLWGLFPLYFPLLEPAGGLEIVAHRVLWSLVFVGLLLTVRRNWSRVRALVTDGRRLLVLFGAAVLIAANWLVFVYGVNSGQVVETSLGYFINPLVSVLLGVVVFSERLRRLQWVAVGIAAVAVAVLTIDYGRPPWIALALAASFGLYAVMKKLVRVEAAPGLFVETALVAVPAGIVLAVLHSGGEGTFTNAGTGHALLLVSSGVATAIPLLLFAAAARRIPLSTVGLLQYVTPLMQLAIGVFVYDEPMPPARLAGFVIVWVALAVFTVDSVRHARAGSRRPVAESVPAGL
ncbi:MAG: putative chloramphenicol resistance permease [Blastococcus sp.]|nr:putative chloramphenicol resistance permease [Blastococcus sp.]